MELFKKPKLDDDKRLAKAYKDYLERMRKVEKHLPVFYHLTASCAVRGINDGGGGVICLHAADFVIKVRNKKELITLEGRSLEKKPRALPKGEIYILKPEKLEKRFSRWQEAHDELVSALSLYGYRLTAASVGCAQVKHTSVTDYLKGIDSDCGEGSPRELLRVIYAFEDKITRRDELLFDT